MSWGIVVTISVFIAGGVCSLFAAYLNARFDAAISKLSKEIGEDLGDMAEKLDDIYVSRREWSQFHSGEFEDLKRRIRR